MMFTYNPHKWTAYVIRRIPTKYLELNEAAQAGWQPKRADMEQIITELQDKLKGGAA